MSNSFGAFVRMGGVDLLHWKWQIAKQRQSRSPSAMTSKKSNGKLDEGLEVAFELFEDLFFA